ncbi:MAG: DUF3822 family protein [Muribaculaceae bacterium]|nr:DUF3822 family protein [Muribaculaceae bacterium]
MEQYNTLNITNPEQFTLLLHFTRDEIRAAAFNPLVDNSLVAATIKIDNKQGNWLKTVENAVYDHPDLLQDYKEVKVLVDTDKFIMAPPDFNDEAIQRNSFAALFPDFDGDWLVTDMSEAQFKVMFGVTRGFAAFLQRTFNMPPIEPTIFAIARFITRNDSDAEHARVHAHFDDNILYVTAVNNGMLLLANTFQPRDINEAFYFISHVWDSLDLDQQHDELFLSGDKDKRDQLLPLMRKYIASVMPSLLPAKALKLSSDANLVPLELIMLALCE